jgi:hypothetical protein
MQCTFIASATHLDLSVNLLDLEVVRLERRRRAGHVLADLLACRHESCGDARAEGERQRMHDAHLCAPFRTALCAKLVIFDDCLERYS